ncbi:MAG: hypothetical protein QOF28_2731 [Actinomycetota bacterium]|nr:hypothetical protein [Actinomycetota bacterium]
MHRSLHRLASVLAFVVPIAFFVVEVAGSRVP